MNIQWTAHRIQTVHPFGISRSSHDHYSVIFVYLLDGDIIGRGEAAPNLRYNETTESVLQQLESGIALSNQYDRAEDLTDELVNQSGRLRSLEAAFSMAALDWWTQKQQISLSAFFENQQDKQKSTSFTIAIGDLDSIKDKVCEEESYEILKVKLGTDQDKQIIQEIRKHTNKVIYVDANEGWSYDTALDMTFWLTDKNVKLIEQPLKADRLSETKRLKEISSIPIIADESVKTTADIPKIANAFDGINIKLMKCGSLFEAYKMIQIAKDYQLKVMLGCMVETSVGITAMSHLSSYADYIDLDGNLLIEDDPYVGTVVEQGKLILPKCAGIGVKPRLITGKLL